MGGTSYAAIKLPANSVGTKLIKSNAVVASKSKDGSLGAKDFAPGQMPTDIQVPQGGSGGSGAWRRESPQGPEGPPAVNGAGPRFSERNHVSRRRNCSRWRRHYKRNAHGSSPVLSNGLPVGWQAAATAPVTAWVVCVA
jgi:hypothetical protein